MRNFKIKVTPEQSEILQKLLFIAGYKWGDDTTDVLYTEVPYLFFDNDDHINQVLRKSNSVNRFNEINYDEITFDEFVYEIEQELNGKL